MSAPDMEVIKEIPGYKVILKAVLKTQIQQLVEQLATHTDEESVILTASVSDGTLSHLGSDSGKGFLEDNEDVKSQFLGFCLKRHHKQKQAEQAQKEREAQVRQQQMLESAQHMAIPAQLGYGPGPAYRRGPRGPYPRPNMPRPPGMPPGAGIRSPSQRFEPYPTQRPQRNSTSSDSGQLSLPTTPIKQEPSEHSNDGVSDSNVTKSPHASGLESKDDDKSNSSSSTIPTDQTDGDKTQGDGDLDPNVSIKVEAITESEMELEITGVEPGIRPIVPQNWDPNVSMGMPFDPNSGATGSPGDMQQSYRTFHGPNYKLNVYECPLCHKALPSKAKLEIHMRVHTGEKPYLCSLCHRGFSQSNNYQRHLRMVHGVSEKKDSYLIQSHDLQGQH